MNESGKCPVCGVAVELIERYPRRVCDQCADSLTDENGGMLRVEFNWSGGFSIISEETGARYAGNVVFSDARRCLIEEDRFGRGVVVQIESD